MKSFIEHVTHQIQLRGRFLLLGAGIPFVSVLILVLTLKGNNRKVWPCLSLRLRIIFVDSKSESVDAPQVIAWEFYWNQSNGFLDILLTEKVDLDQLGLKFETQILHDLLALRIRVNDSQLTRLILDRYLTSYVCVSKVSLALAIILNRVDPKS